MGSVIQTEKPMDAHKQFRHPLVQVTKASPRRYALPGPHPSATEGPHNDPCTPDFKDFARWDGAWARMAAYFGDAVLIALWLR